MLQSIRFLIDENLPVDVADACRQAGFDVVHVLTSELRGSSDPEIWAIAAREQRILITGDLDFPLSLRPGPPGLVIMRVPSRYVRHEFGALARQLLADVDPQRLIGRITVVRPNRPPRLRIWDAH